MSVQPIYSGKVRDLYDAGNHLLFMVASDRLSAFDHVFAERVPDKGRVLTAMTQFWAEHLAGVAPTHLVSTDPARYPEIAAEIDDVTGRAMLVRHAEMLPIECIVRGYLTGSAWKEYRNEGTMHGELLPPGLVDPPPPVEPVGAWAAPVLGAVGFVVGVPAGAVGDGPGGTLVVAEPGVVATAGSQVAGTRARVMLSRLSVLGLVYPATAEMVNVFTSGMKPVDSR